MHSARSARWDDELADRVGGRIERICHDFSLIRQIYNQQIHGSPSILSMTKQGFEFESKGAEDQIKKLFRHVMRDLGKEIPDRYEASQEKARRELHRLLAENPDATFTVEGAIQWIGRSMQESSQRWTDRRSSHDFVRNVLHIELSDLIEYGFLEMTADRKAFRMSALGRWAMGKGGPFPCGYRGDAGVTVLATGEIHAPLWAPMQVLITLCAGARLQSIEHVATFVFSRETLLHGMNRRLDAATFLRNISAASRNPLPQPIVYLIEDVRRNVPLVQAHVVGAVLDLSDSSVADAVLKCAPDTVRRLPNGTLVIVDPEKVDDTLDQLRKSGYITTLQIDAAIARRQSFDDDPDE